MTQTALQVLESRQTEYETLAQQAEANAPKLANVKALIPLLQLTNPTPADVEQVFHLSQNI